MTDRATRSGSIHAIAIHGGAGTILKGSMTPEIEEEYRATLLQSLRVGYDVLEDGGCSLDAVQRAVNVMEDSPLFNAGKGAVFTHEGQNEQDATIMDGATRDAGAVAGVARIRNPVDAARLVMEKSPHLLMATGGAERFVSENGMELVDKDYFYTERRWEQLQKAIEKEDRQQSTSVLSNVHLDHDDLGQDDLDRNDRLGTVGAVALDRSGSLAAATSSGGMTNKRYGRVGDSAIVGAGTYADNKTCAVSTTGYGEYFMRTVTAYDLSALMEYRRMSLMDAADVVMNKLSSMGGTGGLIAIDSKGRITLPFNTPGMYRAFRLSDGQNEVRIWKED